MAAKSKKSGIARAAIPPARSAKAADAPSTNGKAAASLKPLAVRIVGEVPEGTPAYYANFIEISHTKWDFSLIASRFPAKFGGAKLAEARATGILPVYAEVTINFPPTLMVGLIRALTTQKESFEKETNTELKESSEESSSKGQKRVRRRRAAH